MKPFWAGLLRLFATHYSISPDRFWCLSLTETETLLTGLIGATRKDCPSRNTFDQLCKRFPDLSGEAISALNKDATIETA